MFALVGIIISLVVVGIYATVYSSLIIILLFVLAKYTENTFVQWTNRNKFLTWILLGFLLSIIFFINSFTYSNYAGLGDYYCIPIGNKHVISSIDAMEESYIESNQEGIKNQIFIGKFSISETKVCGEFLGNNNVNLKDCYIVFDSETKQAREFLSKEEYSNFSRESKLPDISQFQDFGTNFNNYWNKNKSWLVP